MSALEVPYEIASEAHRWLYYGAPCVRTAVDDRGERAWAYPPARTWWPLARLFDGYAPMELSRDEVSASRRVAGEALAHFAAPVASRSLCGHLWSGESGSGATLTMGFLRAWLEARHVERTADLGRWDAPARALHPAADPLHIVLTVASCGFSDAAARLARSADLDALSPAGRTWLAWSLDEASPAALVDLGEPRFLPCKTAPAALAAALRGCWRDVEAAVPPQRGVPRRWGPNRLLLALARADGRPSDDLRGAFDGLLSLVGPFGTPGPSPWNFPLLGALPLVALYQRHFGPPGGTAMQALGHVARCAGLRPPLVEEQQPPAAVLAVLRDVADLLDAVLRAGGTLATTPASPGQPLCLRLVEGAEASEFG